MKRKSWIITRCMLLTAVIFISTVIHAQQRWQLNFRPGINLPTSKAGDTKLTAGFGFEGTISYRFIPQLNVYAGWGWNHFATKKTDGLPQFDYEETGYSLGLQYIHDCKKTKMKYLLGAGITNNHIEVENRNGDLLADTGHGIGWQAETGVIFSLNKRFSLTPSLRYRSLSRDLKMGDVTANTKLNYVSLGANIGWSF